MKKKSALAAVVICCVMSTGCGLSASEDSTTGTVTSETVTPVIANKKTNDVKVDLSQLSHESIGYGQGLRTDEKNRTVDAVEFTERYENLNAVAIDTDSEKITLTFDQGYENGYTSQILDTLKEKNVKAVFFLLQDYAEKNPELVQRMIDEGHTVGNHSVHHYSMPDLTQAECESEIMDFHRYMQENFNCDMTLFRPPMGEYSEFSLGVTANCGYKSMLWSFAYADWDIENQPDPAEALEKLTNAAHPGAIYLLHSVSSTNAEILGDFIDNVRKDGFEFN
jgi:peptidoglycan-N-acetylmuramic acid deacetylase